MPDALLGYGARIETPRQTPEEEKDDKVTPDNWKLVLAFGGLFLTTVTGPILWALRAESRRIQAELKTLRAEIKTDMVEMESGLKAQITAVEHRLITDMTAMETRLNQRIDTRLVHR